MINLNANECARLVTLSQWVIKEDDKATGSWDEEGKETGEDVAAREAAAQAARQLACLILHHENKYKNDKKKGE